MASKVAIVEFDEDFGKPLKRALDLIGGIKDINTEKRNVCVKVGIFEPSSAHHSSVGLVKALADNFSKAPKVFLTESDNYVGKALDRLQVYKSIFSYRVAPASLSDDRAARRVKVADEEMSLAEVMFKPNVFVDTHVLRSFARGCILKNLFGCTPMVEKAKYHKQEVFSRLIADIYEAIGGIDLAVVNGTHLLHSATQIKVPANVVIAGRDAVAVETVADTLAGLKPEKMELMQEFARRGLGETSLENIEIIGMTREDVFNKFKVLRKELRKKYNSRPRLPSTGRVIDKLIEEGWMDKPRTVAEVLDELKRRGLAHATTKLVSGALERRIGKSLEAVKSDGERAYQKGRK